MKSINGHKFFFPFALALSLIGAVGCGEENQTKRSYSGSLAAINSGVAPGVFGTVGVVLEGDNMDVSVNLVSAPAGIHIQRMMLGSECPTIKHDLNADGFIDAAEALAVTDKAIIPFDGDLTSQEAGAGEYPVDSYTYQESTSFATMLSDLLAPDANPDDSLAKITSADQLSFEGKVVIVHGVPAETVLPATVASIDGLSPQQSFPIACGVIRRDASGGTTTGGETTGGTTTGGETTGGTTTGGTTTGGTTTGGTTTGN